MFSAFADSENDLAAERFQIGARSSVNSTVRNSRTRVRNKNILAAGYLSCNFSIASCHEVEVGLGPIQFSSRKVAPSSRLVTTRHGQYQNAIASNINCKRDVPGASGTHDEKATVRDLNQRACIISWTHPRGPHGHGRALALTHAFSGVLYRTASGNVCSWALRCSAVRAFLALYTSPNNIRVCTPARTRQDATQTF
jgi:hypothetical protein